MSNVSQIKPKETVTASKSRKVVMASLAIAALAAAGVLLVLQVTKWQVEPATPVAESSPAAKPKPTPTPTTQGAARPNSAAAMPADSNAPSPDNRAGGRMVPPNATK